MTDQQAGSDAMGSAGKSLQAFAEETQRVAKQSLDEATAVMDKLRGAKTIQEVVALQTAFLQQSMTRYTEYTRKVTELMTAGSTNMFGRK